MIEERNVQRFKSFFKSCLDKKSKAHFSAKPASFFFLFMMFIALFTKPAYSQDSLRLALNNSAEAHGSVQELQMMLDQNISRLSPVDNNDTTFVTTKPRLLPKNISFAENFLWGENGFFRKVGLSLPLTPEVRKHELEIRRTMLTAHQIGGFATLGLMLATVYYGQKVIDGQRQLGDTHQTLAGLTIASYTLTGLLAILSPPPLIRRDDEESTTTIHKTLAWLHVAGMIITPILASYIGGHKSFNIDKAHVHQIAGYLTTAVFAASLIVVTF